MKYAHENEYPQNNEYSKKGYKVFQENVEKSTLLVNSIIKKISIFFYFRKIRLMRLFIYLISCII